MDGSTPAAPSSVPAPDVPSLACSSAGRRPAARGRRVRARRHCRGRASGSACPPVPGSCTSPAGRSTTVRCAELAAARAGRRAAGRRHRRRQRRGAAAQRAPAGRLAAAGARRRRGQRRRPRRGRRRCSAHGGKTVLRRGQRAAGDRPARPAAGARGDPRGVHPARDRRQGPLPPGRLPGDGAGRDARRRAGRGRAARRRCRTTYPASATCWSSTSAGATTDVYSVVTPQGEDAVLRKEVVEVIWRSRTVEGDLGMRWNAVGVVDAALCRAAVSSGGGAGLRARQPRRAPPTRRTSPATDDDRERRRAARRARGDRRAAPARPRWQGPARGAGSSSAPAACCGTPPMPYADRVLAPAPATWPAAGRCPSRRAPSWTTRYVLAAAGLLAAEHPRGGGAPAAAPACSR